MQTFLRALLALALALTGLAPFLLPPPAAAAPTPVSYKFAYNWRGAWSNATRYAKDDLVSYGGSVWKAKVANLNQTPAAGAYWEIFAERGAQGLGGLALYANATALAAVTGQADGQTAFVKDLGAFRFDAGSTLVANNTHVIAPSIGSGRWVATAVGPSLAPIDVDSYGAKGDGSTDDTAAIQSAVNALKARGGGALVFSAGKTYIHDAEIAFDTIANFVIEGNGATLKSKNSAANTSGYAGAHFTSCSNFEVRNLTIDGNRANRTPAETTIHNFYLRGCIDFRLVNCIAKNGVCDGFYLRATAPADTNTYSKRGVLQGCRGTGNYRQGLSGIEAWHIRVIGCEFDGQTGTPPQSGIDLEPNPSSAAPGCKDWVIQGCSLRDNAGFGVTVSDSSQDIVVAGNTFTNCDRGGVNMGIVENVVVSGNTFATFDSAENAVVFLSTGAKRVNVVGNTFSGCDTATSAIGTGSTAAGIVIANNILRNINVTTATSAAIGAQCPGVLVTGNLIDTAGFIGISISGARPVITNNVVVGTKSRGIHATGADPRITGNYLEAIDSTAAPSNGWVQSTNAAGGHVTGNTLYCNPANTSLYGIRFSQQPRACHSNSIIGFGSTLEVVISGGSATDNTLTGFVGLNHGDAGDPADLSRYKQGGRVVYVRTSTPPVAGTWAVGDRVFYTSTAVGGSIGAVCTTAGTPGTWTPFGRVGALDLTGSTTYDAPSLAASATTTTTVSVTGAALGDLAVASFGVSTAGLVVTATVTAADTVTVALYNPTGGAIDLASTTLRVRVFKQ